MPVEVMVSPPPVGWDLSGPTGKQEHAQKKESEPPSQSLPNVPAADHDSVPAWRFRATPVTEQIERPATPLLPRMDVMRPAVRLVA